MKRRLVVAVTFIAGLYYVLEFLLPVRIGGSPDADGARGGTALMMTARGVNIAYTGDRRDRHPAILGRDLERGAPVTLISPSFRRRDDYRGSETPQFVAPDRLYYIGLGWDDRTPRVCLARRARGPWAPMQRAVLDRGKPGTVDATGISWMSVRPPATTGAPWRMWYVGRQGNIGTACLAQSPDGIRWSKLGNVAIGEPNGDTVDCISATRDGIGVRLWMLMRDAAGVGRLVTAMSAEDGRRIVGEPQRVALGEPEVGPIVEARVEDASSGLIALAAYTRSDGKTAIAHLKDEAQPGARTPRFTTVAAPMISPGAQPARTYLSEARGSVDDLLVIVGSFAVGLGLIGLAMVHGKRITRLRKGWPESTAFFCAAIAMASLTVYSRTHPDARNLWTRGYDLFFNGLLLPLGSSMFSLLACYLVSAAYRAFKVRSLESSLLAASATLLMLGQVPVGNWLTQSLPSYMQIPTVMAWVLFVTNNAVVRAVNFGIFVGALATALRIWLSMDRAAMRSFD